MHATGCEVVPGVMVEARGEQVAKAEEVAVKAAAVKAVVWAATATSGKQRAIAENTFDHSTFL